MKTIEQLQQEAIFVIENENFTNNPKTLYEPIDYAMHQGGKRIRPLLVLMAADMFFCPTQKAYGAAKAVEVLHNFTLLHDDIMDASPLRRGKLTVYNKYDTNTAILSGDTMFALAYTYLFEYKDEVLAQLTRTLTLGSIGVCQGQAMDMCFETRNDVTLAEYIEMIRKKTGVLIATALAMGAIVAGASQEEVSSLYAFGENIGIAFQIQDDLLDCWSDLEAFGKVTGKDIADRKKTYLYLTAIQKADKTTKAELISLYSNENWLSIEQTEQRLKALYETMEVRQNAMQDMLSYNKKAFAQLEKINIDSNRKTNLITFAEKLIKRNK